MHTARVATVKSTGHRYLVEQLDFRDNVAVCRGEVVGHRGLSTRHRGMKNFPLADVTVATVELTTELVVALFAQGTATVVAGMRPGQELVVTGLCPEVKKSIYEAIGAGKHGVKFNRKSARVTR